MDIREATENALMHKILARCERCPWELVRAARDLESVQLYGRFYFLAARERYRAMIEKYVDSLPAWLED